MPKKSKVTKKRRKQNKDTRKKPERERKKNKKTIDYTGLHGIHLTIIFRHTMTLLEEKQEEEKT